MATILVVDDEAPIRETFQAFLANEGHEVHVAANYDEAVRRLHGAPLDLVYLDILLGGKSGIDVLQYARAEGSTALFVVITGEPSVDSAIDALRLGAYDFISKPINKQTLLHSARVALDHKALQDEKRRLVIEKEQLRLHLEAIFQSVSSSVITLDAQHRIVRANRATWDVLHLDPDRLTGQLCADTLGKRSPAFCDVLQQTLANDPVHGFRIELPAGDFPPQTLVLDGSPLLTADGRQVGAVLLSRDITRQVTLERAANERSSYRTIVGKSDTMQEIYRLIEDLSKTDTSVLITGPSGTGKELVAEALHNNGPRSTQQLVKVNCSALSENLLESELFGHVRGAFTGAVRDKAGRFRLAHKGTIFLDEIGDISPRIQLNLLRVLQEKEFERVGDTQTIKVDVRVIAATNVDLREMVRRGQFREDLFYRLKVVELQLPALKDRREDIPLLLDHFLAYFSRQMGKRIQGVSADAQHLLMGYPWPGNIRELRHAIEHAFILCRSNRIEAEHLPREIRESALNGQSANGARALDREMLQEALSKTGGNKAKAARLLNISRQTIYRKIEEYDLDS